MMKARGLNSGLRRWIIFIAFAFLAQILLLILWHLVINGSSLDVSADWPTYRYNAQHTGMSPAQTRIINPEIQWSISLGVQPGLILAYDLVDDLQSELLSVEGGTLACRNLQGDLIWRSGNHVLRDIIGVYDLDMDGVKEIVLTALPADIVILSVSDGTMLWRRTLPDSAGAIGYQNVRIGDVAPSRKGLEMVTWVPYNNTGLVYTFEDGAQNAEVYLELNAKSEKGDPVSYPSLSFVDIENDGVLDITTPGWAQLYVFDGETGEQKRSVYWLTEGMNKRIYGHIAWVNIDDDPYPEAVALSSSVIKHFSVIDNDGQSLSLLWDHFYEEVFSDDLIDIRQVMNSVTDLDGDGKAEIAVSLFNADGKNTWHTLIINPIVGVNSPLLDLEGRFLWGVEDLDGDDLPELMLSKESTRKPVSLSDLSVFAFREGQWQEVWFQSDAHFIEQYHRELPDNISSLSTFARQDIWITQINSDKIRQFFYGIDQDQDGSQDDLVLWDLNNEQAVWSRPLTDAGLGIFDISQETPRNIFTSLSSGQIGVLDLDGSLHYQFAAGAFGGVTPIVADLDTDGFPEVVVPTAGGEITVYNLKDGEVELQWKINGFGRAIYGLNRSVVAADLDKDGLLELLIGQFRQDEPWLLALNPDGTILWEHRFEGFPAGNSSGGGLYEWTAGRWGKGAEMGVFAAINRGGLSAGEGFGLDGRTGEVLWHQTKIDGYVFNPEGVVSVLDVDKNGVDELAIIAKNVVSILDATSGETYQPFLTAMMDVAQYGFAGYGSPIVVDVLADGNPKLLLGGNFGGNGLYDLDLWPVWWADAEEFEVQGRMPGMGDVDSDGALEVAISYSDGTLSVHDAVNGVMEWQLDLGTITTDIISADLDGDTFPEFLFGTQDGRLMAIQGSLDAGGEILWEVNLNFELSSPIVADADGDGMIEILIVAGDGRLYAIR